MEINYGVLFMLTLCCSVQDIIAAVQRENAGNKKNKHGISAWSPKTDLEAVKVQVNHHKPDDVQVGCQELRSKRYISDGFCTSKRPITEVICTGHCLPIRELPWYAEFVKVWANTKVQQWRCVNDVTRRKRVTLVCDNGEIRHYRIKIVKSCKCKRYHSSQNRSRGTTASPRTMRKDKSRRTKGKSRKDNQS